MNHAARTVAVSAAVIVTWVGAIVLIDGPSGRSRARAQDPQPLRVVILDPAPGPPRAVIVLLDGRYYSVMTTPITPLVPGTPAPPPPVPNNPDPGGKAAEDFGMAPFVRTWLPRVALAPAAVARDATKVVAVLRKAAARAGTSPATYPDAQALETDVALKGRQDLGADYPAWKPFFDALFARLEGMQSQDNPWTVTRLGAAYAELAYALEQAGK